MIENIKEYIERQKRRTMKNEYDLAVGIIGGLKELIPLKGVESK